MDALAYIYMADDTYVQVFQAILRYLMPVLAAILLFRFIRPLLTFRREPEIWAWLCLEDERRIPISHWENVIGSHKRSDVVMALESIVHSHAVLTRYDDGSWTIAATCPEGAVYVNGKRVGIAPVGEKDKITIGNVKMRLLPMNKRQEGRLAELRTEAAAPLDSLTNLLLLSLIIS